MFGELIFIVLYNNLFILHLKSEGKTKKSESVVVSEMNQLCAAVFVFINVPQYPILHETYSLNLGLKQ